MKSKLSSFFLLLTGTLIILSPTQAQNTDYPISGNTNPTTEEGEAHIAINPNDSLKMVMGYMQVGVGSLEFKVHHSSDGGNTWQASSLNTTTIAATDYPSHSVIGGGDIVFAYDNNGDLFCSWINLLADLTQTNPLDTAIWAAYWAKSTDNGNTFTLANGNDRFFGSGKVRLTGGLSIHNYLDGICDRQWMAVDLSNGTYQNNLYIGYINYPFNINQTGLKVKSKSAIQNTFSSATTAYQGNGQLTNIGVDTNGVLHYTFCDILSNSLLHVSSSDGGQTFSTSHSISSATNVFPQSNQVINSRENAAPSLAIDGANNLHLVWADFPLNQQPLAYYSYSTNGGINWSTPLALSGLFGNNVFMPVVSAKNNHISIGGNVIDALKKSEYHIISSADNGNTFSTPVKISSGITDFTSIGLTPFVGDYSSSVRTNCNIFSLWTDCRSGACKQYISKYNECLSTGITELTPVESSFSLERIYPVPVKEELQLIVQSQIRDILFIELFNSIGQKLSSYTRPLISGENQITLTISEFDSGQYIVKLTNQKGTYTTRSILKQ